MPTGASSSDHLGFDGGRRELALAADPDPGPDPIALIEVPGVNGGRSYEDPDLCQGVTEVVDVFRVELDVSLHGVVHVGGGGSIQGLQLAGLAEDDVADLVLPFPVHDLTAEVSLEVSEVGQVVAQIYQDAVQGAVWDAAVADDLGRQSLWGKLWLSHSAPIGRGRPRRGIPGRPGEGWSPGTRWPHPSYPRGRSRPWPASPPTWRR